MSGSKEVLEKLFRDEEIKRARERFVRYLAAYKVVEANLALFDKMARCRDISELLSAIYEGVRVKDRVLARLEDGVKRGEYKITFECKDVKGTFSVGHDDVEKLIDLARCDPKLVGTVLATLALAYGGVQPTR